MQDAGCVAGPHRDRLGSADLLRGTEIGVAGRGPVTQRKLDLLEYAFGPPVRARVIPGGPLLTAYPFETHGREAAEPERVHRGRRHVDNSSSDERSPIIDPHYDTAVISLVGDTYFAAERQRPMRGSKPSRMRR